MKTPALIVFTLLTNSIFAQPRNLPELRLPDSITAQMQIAPIANLNAKFGTSSEVDLTALAGINQLLADIGYQVEQQADGILIATNTDNTVELAFLPDTDKITQGPENSGPVLSIHEKTGQFQLILASNEQIPVNPAPKTLEGLLDILPEGTQLTLGDEADVRLTLPNDKTSKVVMGIFDPLITKMGHNLEPGLYFEGQPGIDEQIRVVYPETTQQILYPAVQSPQLLKAIGETITGVQEITVRVNGSIMAIMESGDNSNNLLIELIAGLEIKPSANSEAAILPNEDGTFTFTNETGDQQQLYITKISQAITTAPEVDIEQPAEITSVTETRFLSPEQTATDLYLTVNNMARVERASVTIRLPLVASMSSDNASQPAIEGFVSLDLPCHADNRCENNTSVLDPNLFTEPGKYQIFYFITDNQTFEFSPFSYSMVYKSKLDNQPPSSPQLLHPLNGAMKTTNLVFDWETTTDPDGDAFTYTLTVAEDSNFGIVVYQLEEIFTDITLVNTDVILQDGSHGFKDATTYYWKIEAVDDFGSKTSSDVFSFITDNTNAPPSVASLYVSSAVNFTSLDQAEIDFWQFDEFGNIKLDEFGNPMLMPSTIKILEEEPRSYDFLFPPGFITP
jgi:hypothetical protein